MGSYQIEMLWRCTSCQFENLGRHKECVNCGSPLEEDEEFYMPGDTSKAAAVTDSEQLKHALAGADWNCKYCDSQQRKLNGDCAICGAPQDERAEAEKLEALFKEEEKLSKFDDLDKVDTFPEYKTQPKTKPKVEKKESIYRKKKTKPSATGKLYDTAPKRNWKPFALGAAGFLACCLLLFLIFHKKIVDVHVGGVYWVHTVQVDRYKIYTGEGFDESMPSGAFEVKQLGNRHHHYKQVQDGYRTEHYTVREACGVENYTTTESYQCGENCTQRCTSNKNGYATCTPSCSPKYCTRSVPQTRTKYCNVPKTREVPKYKDVSVEEMYYSWKVWKWSHDRDVSARGNTLDTYWPTSEEINLCGTCQGKEQERTNKVTKYEVKFVDEDNEEYKYYPKTLEGFKQFPKGSTHRISVSIADGVEIVKEK